MEQLTDDLEAEIWKLIKQIDDMGGAVKAIEQGFQKGEIEDSAFAYAQGIDSGERVQVGVNRFTVEEEEKYEPLRVDPTIGEQQAARLTELRAGRDNAAVDAALAKIKAAAEGSDNLLYPMKEALQAKATIGEVCNALRGVWGTYTPSDAAGA
ncbi:Methylmalonyl-CoA mutase large subunit [bioreactor metagenome]|uniref:Methylmalonyl-CoA mutase large subunit n=1 Tax=bioreactor metagenome TaxID=1076179 RepID=A0A645CZ80_9ZZZZ